MRAAAIGERGVRGVGTRVGAACFGTAAQHTCTCRAKLEGMQVHRGVYMCDTYLETFLSFDRPKADSDEF